MPSKAISDRLSLATNYAYGLMRRAFDEFDIPQHFALAVKTEIAIRNERQKHEEERQQEVARRLAAEAAARETGLLSRLFG